MSSDSDQKAITQYTSEAEASNNGLFRPTEVPAGLADPRFFKNIVPAGVHVDLGPVASFLQITADNQHSGVGHAFDMGGEFAVSKGVFAYNSWDTLKSEKNTIFLEARNEVLIITFSLHSTPTIPEAMYAVVVEQLQDFPKAVGHFNWN
ncbi:hypothetical protein BV25DRAFT_1913587 [Artomyces pyxidatus]|uniref:Uncharacterized protein n=1 Tax=Artomyces pyxidatus TaxID=48021 RepID=A0ACB8TBK5_9AGAM|nr:hypothetical protein BV25DRAFT_1913587 [Artomyces pyxidatus]